MNSQKLPWAFTLLLIGFCNDAWCEWSTGDSGWQTVIQSAAKNTAHTPAIASVSGKTVLLWSDGVQRKIKVKWWDPAGSIWDKEEYALPAIPGGQNPSASSIVNSGSNILDVAVLANGEYLHCYYLNNTWSNWESLGVPPPGEGSAPAISASRKGARIVDIWVISGAKIWRKRWQNPQWKEWELIGSPEDLHGVAPGVTVRSDNIIDVVAPTKSNGQLWHGWFGPEGKFGGWEKIDGNTWTQPALSSPSPDRLDVWVKGASDGSIYHNVWTNADQWHGFEMAINSPDLSFVSGPSVDIAPNGQTTVAAVASTGNVVTRSWAEATGLPFLIPGPTPNVKIRRPMTTSPNRFLVVDGSEASISVVPADLFTCKPRGGAVFLSTHIGELQRQDLGCVLSGTNAQIVEGYEACESTIVRNASHSITGTSWDATDNQVVAGKSGAVVWIHQNCYNNPTTRTNGDVLARGVEEIHYTSSCGSQWASVLLDPCDPKSPISSKFCNQNAEEVCDNVSSGLDRPEVFASRIDGAIYMSTGNAGTKDYNLMLFRSKVGAGLYTWDPVDTGLGSGSAVSFSENESHLYLARCVGADVELYGYDRKQVFGASSLVRAGTIGKDCEGDPQIWVNRTSQGAVVVLWVYPSTSSNKWVIRRGASVLTPGGLVQLKGDTYTPDTAAALPTLIPGFKNRSLLYWYELDSANKWSIKAAIGDGYSNWTSPFTVSNGTWSTSVAGPWNWKFSDRRSAPWDYVKGAPIQVGNSTQFLLQWIQPVAGANEVFYGIVK